MGYACTQDELGQKNSKPTKQSMLLWRDLKRSSWKPNSPTRQNKVSTQRYLIKDSWSYLADEASAASSGLTT